MFLSVSANFTSAIAVQTEEAHQVQTVSMSNGFSVALYGANGTSTDNFRVGERVEAEVNTRIREFYIVYFPVLNYKLISPQLTKCLSFLTILQRLVSVAAKCPLAFMHSIVGWRATLMPIGGYFSLAPTAHQQRTTAQ